MWAKNRLNVATHRKTNPREIIGAARGLMVVSAWSPRGLTVDWRGLIVDSAWSDRGPTRGLIV